MCGIRLDKFVGSLAVLVGASPSLAQLPGFEIVQITDTPGFLERTPRMNDCGEVVYSRFVDLMDHLEEVYLYDNGKTTRITDNLIRDAFPDINNLGVMTWTQNADGFGGGTIVLYDDGTLTEIDEPGSASRINDQGHLAYIVKTDPGCGSGNRDIFFFDGQSITRLTQDALSNQSISLNNLDELAWTRFDFCQNPWQSEIMLYSQGNLFPVTDGHFQPNVASLNDFGVVAWITNNKGGLNNWIDVWEDGRVTRLSDGVLPSVNNAGHISFSRDVEEPPSAQAWLYRDGGFELAWEHQNPLTVQDLNIFDEMVIYEGLGFPESELWVMRRIRNGDGNLDGAIDLEDHRDFAICIMGPVETDRLCDCRFFDLDHDRDVDLADFGELQNGWLP